MFCLHQTLELILQGLEREGEMPQRGGREGGGGCRDEWMDGVADGSRYSHIR